MKKALVITAWLIFAIFGIGLFSYVYANSMNLVNNYENSETEKISPEEGTKLEKEKKTTPYQDPSLVTALDSIGYKVDFSDLKLQILTQNEIADKCNWEKATGCHDHYDKALYVTQDFSLRSLAHEYLHYVWYKEKLDDDKTLRIYLRDFYADNEVFRNRIDSFYTELPKDTEIFSYACSELSNVRLGSYLAYKCNLYIDTDKLPDLY